MFLQDFWLTVTSHHASQIIILMNFVAVSNVIIKRGDCTEAMLFFFIIIIIIVVVIFIIILHTICDWITCIFPLCL